MDLLQLFGYEELTGVVQKFQHQNLQLVDMVPEHEIDGDIATWQIKYPDIEVYDYFTGRSGAATAIRQSDFAEKTFSMPYRFAKKTFDGGVLNQLEKIGTREYDSSPMTNIVDSEIKEMDWRVGAYTDEYLIGQALQGSLTIKLGTTGSYLNKSINYEIPAGNQFTNAVGWGASPTTATPIGDFQTAIDIAGEYGVELTQALMSSATANKLSATTQVQGYVQGFNIGLQHLEAGTHPNILGIRPTLIRSRYASVGQTGGFKNKLIPDNTVIFLPDWPSAPLDWIEMQVGNFWIPNDMQNGLTRSVKGKATWASTTDDPTGITVFHKVLKFPVIRKPWVIVKMLVG